MNYDNNGKDALYRGSDWVSAADLHTIKLFVSKLHPKNRKSPLKAGSSNPCALNAWFLQICLIINFSTARTQRRHNLKAPAYCWKFTFNLIANHWTKNQTITNIINACNNFIVVYFSCTVILNLNQCSL